MTVQTDNNKVSVEAGTQHNASALNSMHEKISVSLLVENVHLIEEIAQLKFHEFASLSPGKTVDDFVTGLKSHLNDKKLPTAYVLVNDSKEFIGTFSIRAHDMSTHQHLTPWIGSVLVHPGRRNRGLGAFIVNQAESIAKEMGYSQLYLFTPNKEEWYQKLGWKTIEHTTFNNHPVAVMIKYLL